MRISDWSSDVCSSDLDIVAMLREHARRDRARAGAEAAVGLLQRDDIGVEFAEHREHPSRDAAPVEPDALAHVVGGDLDHGEERAVLRLFQYKGRAGGIWVASHARHCERKRSNPERFTQPWIASSLRSSQ